jgi:hypothetical protein
LRCADINLSLLDRRLSGYHRGLCALQRRLRLVHLFLKRQWIDFSHQLPLVDLTVEVGV